MAAFDEPLGRGPFSSGDEGTRQREVFVCTFGLLALLCTIDGSMDKSELKVIDGIMKNSLKLEADRRKFATSIFNLAMKSDVTVDTLLVRYRDAVADRPKMYEWLMDVLYRVSLADEVLAQEEMNFLTQVQKKLGVSDEVRRKIKGRYTEVSELADAYATLGLPDGAAPEEVQKAYEQLMSDYDAEALIEDGFAKELIEIAQERQAAYSTAYMAIQKN